MAPIHFSASIAETLMQRNISTNLMKKHTHPNLDGLMGEHIFSKCSLLSEPVEFNKICLRATGAVGFHFIIKTCV